MTPSDELCAYTLSLGDAAFLHQLVVDAQTLQSATDATKPIARVFALLSLYLSVERHISGRQIQRFHMQLAQRKIAWPGIALPAQRGELTAADVLAAPAGEPRHRALHAWCRSVWQAYAESHGTIIEFTHRHLDLA